MQHHFIPSKFLAACARRTALCLLSLLSLSFNSLAQTPDIKQLDSLKAAIASLKSNAGQFPLLLRLTKGYTTRNTTEAIAWGQKAVALSESLTPKENQEVLIALGSAYLQAGKTPLALEQFFSALRRAEESDDDLGTGVAYGNIAAVYDYRSAYDTALSYQQRALQIYTRRASTNEPQAVANTLSNIGHLYKEKGDFSTAQAKYDEALRRYRDINDEEGIARCLGNIGNIYLNTGDLVAAIKKHQEAIAIAQRIGDRLAVARGWGNIGLCYLSIAQDSSPPRYVTIGLVPSGRAGNLRLAIDYFSKAFEESERTGYLEGKIYFARQLSEAYDAQGAKDQALRYYKIYADANDSVVSVSSAARVEELKTEREQMLKEKQIALDKLAVQKKRNERGFFAVGIVLLLLIVLFIARERRRSERLLLNVLPRKIARRLKQDESPIADYFANASVMFIDMEGFTRFFTGRDPKDIVSILDDIFTLIDGIAEQFGLEKIKTIGDCYMAVAGLPELQPDHAVRAAGMALAVQRRMAEYRAPDGAPIAFRIGLDCGPVVAGVIGKKKFIYDLWGDAVNTASRMESTGVAGQIHCTDEFRKAAAGGPFRFESRGTVSIKGKGEMQTWFIESAAG